MKPLSNLFKSRKLILATIAQIIRRIPFVGSYIKKAKFRHYFQHNINISAITRCSGSDTLSNNDNLALTAKIEHANGVLRKIVNDINIASSNPSNEHKKIIWMYWDKGLDNAPEVVKLSYQSWTQLNPDYEVRFLDSQNLRAIADFDAAFSLSSIDLGLAHKSDFIRTYLLSRFGGVWVDSTSFCWAPLDSWLDEAIEMAGFFIFRQPVSRHDRQIANWFIAAKQGNELVTEMFNELFGYLFKERCTSLQMLKYKYYAHLNEVSRDGSGYPLLEVTESKGYYPYHFYHYLFNEVVKRPSNSNYWSKALRTPNRFVGSNGPIDDVLVSKQSYRSHYTSSSTYKHREKMIIKLLNPPHQR